MSTNRKIYFLSLAELFCLFLGAAAFFFSFYILPRILFSIDYEVPGFVILLEVWYQQNYNIHRFFAIYLPFLLTSFVFFYLARLLNRQLESMEQHLPPDELSAAEKFLGAPNSLLKIAVALVFVTALLVLIAWGLDYFLAALFA